MNILEPRLHAMEMETLGTDEEGILDFRHPYYRSLKRLVMLDKGRVAETVELLEVMLRNWPDLDKEEQAFCKGQLNRVIRSINRLQFAGILDAWSASCTDVSFFPKALKKNPAFYRDLADRLVNNAEELKMRINLMANFEIYWLERVNRAVDLLSSQQSSYWQWQNLRQLLKRGVRGYYRLSENSTGLHDERFSHLLKRIYLNTLDRLLDNPGWGDSPSLSNEVKCAVSDYLDDFDSPEHVSELEKFLQRAKFFDQEYLWVFRIKEHIQFAAGNYAKVIRDCEAKLGEAKSCPPEEGQECIRLMLLLTDAHIAAHLLSSAIPVLSRAEEMGPDRMDVGWRMFQVHQIIGVGKELAALMSERFHEIENSRVLEISLPAMSQDVYLLDRQELELRISHQMLSRMRSPGIIQVMMDGCVVTEIAISDCGNRTSLSIPLKCPGSSHHHVAVSVM